MTTYCEIECLECNHVHELEIIRGREVDLVVGPERCENCGAELSDGKYADDARSERQQMGITY